MEYYVMVSFLGLVLTSRWTGKILTFGFAQYQIFSPQLEVNTSARKLIKT